MGGSSFLHTQKIIFDIECRIKAAHVRNGTPKNRYTKSEKLINIPTDSFYRMSYVYLTHFIHRKNQNILYVGKTGMTRGDHILFFILFLHFLIIIFLIIFGTKSYIILRCNSEFQWIDGKTLE